MQDPNDYDALVKEILKDPIVKESYENHKPDLNEYDPTKEGWFRSLNWQTKFWYYLYCFKEWVYMDLYGWVVDMPGWDTDQGLIRRRTRNPIDTYTYECIRDKDHNEDWRVEACHYQGEGDGYITIFSGTNAEQQAKEYLDYKQNKESRYDALVKYQVWNTFIYSMIAILSALSLIQKYFFK